MRITMIGTGYVGLVSGTCFSEFGFFVECIDNNQEKIDLLNSGYTPIFENGLSDLIKKNTSAKRLSFSTNLKASVLNTDVIFLCVGTPNLESGEADLRYIIEAARNIAPYLNTYKPIVIKSTVPVGTGRKISQIIKDVNPKAQFSMISNPEFLREGAAIEDFMHPNRIIIGLENSNDRQIMETLYRPLYLLKTPILFTNLETAELIKYSANAFLATKITFINEIADLCEKVGADIQDVSTGMGLDKRIGDKFLHTGPGYGGSCFPKDTMALLHTAKLNDSPLKIVDAVVSANYKRKVKMVYKIQDALNGSVENKTIAILGLSFKPNTDDVRESPALTIINGLLNKNANIRAFDPVAMPNTKKELPSDKIYWATDAYDATKGASTVVIITEWNEFRFLDLKRIYDLLKNTDQPTLIDFRNIYTEKEVIKSGLKYISLGRNSLSITSPKSIESNI